MMQIGGYATNIDQVSQYHGISDTNFAPLTFLSQANMHLKTPARIHI